jgi:hypothetical protein
MSGRIQRVPSGALPLSASQKLPKASNTMALEDQVREIKQGKWISILLGMISALIIVIMLALGVWYIISPLSIIPEKLPIGEEMEIQWNTEHMEKF